MVENKSPSQLLAEAQKQQEELANKIQDLLKQTRDEDLATVKRLVKTHSFTATDLKDVLKTRAAASTNSPTGKRPYNRKKK
jgi:hypothetical protein